MMGVLLAPQNHRCAQFAGQPCLSKSGDSVRLEMWAKGFVHSLHKRGCVLCHFGARMRLSLCLAGKSIGNFISEFAWRRSNHLCDLFRYNGIALYAKAGCFAAIELLCLVDTGHGVCTVLRSVFEWDSEVFQSYFLCGGDSLLDGSGL